MNIFNWRPKTITLDDQKSVLVVAATRPPANPSSGPNPTPTRTADSSRNT